MPRKPIKVGRPRAERRKCEGSVRSHKVYCMGKKPASFGICIREKPAIVRNALQLDMRDLAEKLDTEVVWRTLLNMNVKRRVSNLAPKVAGKAAPFGFCNLLVLHLIFGKVTKFLVEKFSILEVISQKPHGGAKQGSF